MVQYTVIILCMFISDNSVRSGKSDQFLGSTQFLQAPDTNQHTFNMGHAYNCLLNITTSNRPARAMLILSTYIAYNTYTPLNGHPDVLMGLHDTHIAILNRKIYVQVVRFACQKVGPDMVLNCLQR